MALSQPIPPSLPWLFDGQHRPANLTDLAPRNITVTHGTGSGKTVAMGVLLHIKLLSTRRREQIEKEPRQEESLRRIELRTRRRDLIVCPRDRVPLVFQTWEPPELPVDLRPSDSPLPWGDVERPAAHCWTPV